MSVLVKGMKMPNHCMDCILKNADDDCMAQEWQEWETWGAMRKGCPLVELPEKHGDLIDKQKLMKEMIFVGDRPVTTGLRFIREAPVIIEAEGE